jgi:hypothetical protein
MENPLLLRSKGSSTWWCNLSAGEAEEDDEFRAILSYMVRSCLKNPEHKSGVVVHTYNPSYSASGGRNRRTESLRPAWAKVV